VFAPTDKARVQLWQRFSKTPEVMHLYPLPTDSAFAGLLALFSPGELLTWWVIPSQLCERFTSLILGARLANGK
jgi:hypothetical protein